MSECTLDENVSGSGCRTCERELANLRARAERVEAEVARLRDALDAIEGGHPCDEEHRELARAALAPAGEGGT